MPISSSSSMQALLKERKYPFVLLTGTLLLIVLTLLLSFSSSTGGGPLFPRPFLFSSSDLHLSSATSSSSSSSPPPRAAPSSDSELPSRDNTATSSTSSSSSSSSSDSELPSQDNTATSSTSSSSSYSSSDSELPSRDNTTTSSSSSDSELLSQDNATTSSTFSSSSSSSSDSELLSQDNASTSSTSSTSSSSSTPAPPSDDSGAVLAEAARFKWELCKGPYAVDYIPCLDNLKAIKALKSREHMEHRERHCPTPAPRCLVPMPTGYKVPVPWPKSKDMIWYNNVPHPKLVEYKKDQNWVAKYGEYFIFPGGGTQFKHGVTKYIELVEKTVPDIGFGKHVRVALDIGCGVASFGGFLLDRDVMTMSFAPKDEHEAQIQFALERGIPATLSVIGNLKLTFPDNAFDMLHCARCRIRWDADGGKPMLELNRILRPGGYFVWSATPVYRKDELHKTIWNLTIALTKTMCWEFLDRKITSSWFGIAVFRKTASSSCYETQPQTKPSLCENQGKPNSSWYAPLSDCISRIPVNSSWPSPWPERLASRPPSLPTEAEVGKSFEEDTKHWSALISDVYWKGVGINWKTVRNVMDMNAGYGGFAAALIDMPMWVMNVVPIDMQDTLSVIYDRGLIGVYHDWCESFNTYPRTYDLLHAGFLFKNITKRCDIVQVVAEIDRVLRPGGYLLVQDTGDVIEKLRPILLSLYWRATIHQGQFLVGMKGFWRPEGGNTNR